MDYTATETKVQIRLSTRDAGLQIAEEPTVLLVQTCKSIAHARSLYQMNDILADSDCRIMYTLC